MEYAAAKRQMVTEATHVGIEGVRLQTRGKEAAGEGLIGIGWCVCVQDSPENPCPCNGGILWLPEAAVVNESDTGRKSADGDDILRFMVKRDADIVVETYSPVRADALSRIERSVSSSGNLPGKGGRRPRGQAVGWVAGAIEVLVAAYHFGKEVDKDTEGGISDYLADAIEGYVWWLEH